MENNTKYIGYLSETAFLFKCAKYGLSVYKPTNDYSKTDFILELEDGRLFKIQCKTLSKANKSKNSFITKLSATKEVYHSNGQHSYTTVGYSLKEVDIFALYSKELKDVFLVPTRSILDKNGNIQKTISLNFDDKLSLRQKTGIRFCSDYKFSKVIKELIKNQEIKESFIPIPEESKYALKNDVSVKYYRQTTLNRIGESGYKGVTKNTSGRKGYKSYLQVNGKKIYIGQSEDPRELALKYDEKVIELLGDKAVTNKSLGLL
jgi:hypothetical protein